MPPRHQSDSGSSVKVDWLWPDADAHEVLEKNQI